MTAKILLTDKSAMRHYIAIIIMLLGFVGISAKNPFGDIPTVDKLPVYQDIDTILSIDKDIEIELESVAKNLLQVQNEVVIDINLRKFYVPICIYRNNGARFLLYLVSDRYVSILYLASLDSGNEFPPTLCVLTDNISSLLTYRLTPDNTITIESRKEPEDEPRIVSVYRIVSVPEIG